jgi:WD40 repeat protein
MSNSWTAVRAESRFVSPDKTGALAVIGCPSSNGHVHPEPPTLAVPGVAAPEMATLRRVVSPGGVRPAPLPPTLDPDSQLPKIPGYQILRRLGGGGMGVVFLAREVALNRLVALKVVPGGVFADAEALERFDREAEAVATLQHPNIVQIFCVGRCDIAGGPFIALEFADGGTLAAHVGKPMPPRAAAETVATIARAIHYAHGRGIVHRDLKPGNVLLQAAPQTPAGGTELPDRFILKVSDFGLAKRVDVGGSGGPKDAPTVAGSMLGTPEYMAPEQACGFAGVGRAADVYALGVILYELLTGRVPLRGADALDTLVRVRTQEPAPLSKIIPHLPRDLDTICQRSLEKDPNRRYASAAALADDLQAWLDGRPIAARRVGAVERAWKWARRRPAVAFLIATVIVVTITGFAAVSREWRLADARATAERIAHERADAARDVAETNLFFGRISRIQHEFETGNHADAVRMLDACRPAAGEPDRRSWEWNYLNNVGHSERLSFTAASDWIWDAAYSPDGQMLAIAAGTPYFPYAETQPGELTLWDPETGRLVRRLQGHTGTVRRIAFSPDGRYLCSAGYDKTLRIWAMPSGEPVGAPLACSAERRAFLDACGDAGPCWFTADSQAIDYRGPDGWKRFHIASRETIPLANLASAMKVSRDGHIGVFRRDAHLVEAVEIPTGRSIGQITHPENIDRVALSADGKTVVFNNNSHIEMRDAALGRWQRRLDGPTAWIECLAIGGDGRRVAAGGAGRTVHVWDTHMPFPIAYSGHQAEIRALAFSPDSQRLASCDRTGRVIIWDLTRNPRQQLIFSGTNSSQVSGIGLSADGQELMLTIVDQRLHKFDMAGRRTAECLLEGFTKLIKYPRHDVQFSPDGTAVFAPLDNEPGAVGRWATATGAVVQTYRGLHGPVTSTAVSGDGRRLVTHSATTAETCVWDIASGSRLCAISGDALVGMALSATGGKFAAVNGAGELITWDAVTGQDFWRTRAHGSDEDSAAGRVSVFAVAFSPDEKLLATAGRRDGVVKLWRADTGQSLMKPLVAPLSLTGIAFTPDGRRVAAAGYDSEVRMWDVATGQLDIVLAPPTGPRPADIAYTARPIFSQRNQRLALLDWRGFIGCWDGSKSGD